MQIAKLIKVPIPTLYLTFTTYFLVTYLNTYLLNSIILVTRVEITFL